MKKIELMFKPVGTECLNQAQFQHLHTYDQTNYGQKIRIRRNEILLDSYTEDDRMQIQVLNRIREY